MRTALKLSIAALAATTLLPLAPASATTDPDTDADTQTVCRVEVIVYQYPSAGWIYVETGRYGVYQDCVYIES